MPSRFLTWAIVIFWLSMTTWLFCREFLPWFETGLPPRFFKPEFADEVRPNQLRWQVYRDQQEIGADIPTTGDVGWLTTHIKRQDDRTFVLGSELMFNIKKLPPATEFRALSKLLKQPVRGQIKVLSGTYRVGPRGKLRAFASEVTIHLGEGNQVTPVKVSISGEVHRGRCTPRLRINDLGTAWNLSPFDVTARGGIIDPMHPLQRIPEQLVDGRRWRIPLVVPPIVPLADLATPFVPTVDARLSAGTLHWGGGDEDCWMIDYRLPKKGAIMARTWVRRSDQRILCQEAIFQDSRLVIVRGPIGQ